MQTQFDDPSTRATQQLDPMDTLPLGDDLSIREIPIIELISPAGLESLHKYLGDDNFKAAMVKLQHPLSHFLASIPINVIPLLVNSNQVEWTEDDIKKFSSYIDQMVLLIDEDFSMNNVSIHIETQGDYGLIKINNDQSEIHFPKIYLYRAFFVALHNILTDTQLAEELFQTIERKEFTEGLVEMFITAAKKQYPELDLAKADPYARAIFIPKVLELVGSVLRNIMVLKDFRNPNEGYRVSTSTVKRKETMLHITSRMLKAYNIAN